MFYLGHSVICHIHFIRELEPTLNQQTGSPPNKQMGCSPTPWFSIVLAEGRTGRSLMPKQLDHEFLLPQCLESLG